MRKIMENFKKINKKIKKTKAPDVSKIPLRKFSQKKVYILKKN